MIIAVNTRLLPGDFQEEYGNFIYETFKRITKNNPEHQFLFIVERPFKENFIVGENVKTVVVRPVSRHPLLWNTWYSISIAAVLRKYKADVFVSGDSCSLRTKVPQCMVVHHLAFLHYPLGFTRAQLLFYKRNMPAFLRKAVSIATVSEFSKRDIIQQYKTEAAKIDILFNGVKEIFQPLNEEHKSATKNTYTEGKEYFVYAGPIHPRKNVMNLLKAFSLFKKRQQTNMKLVLTGRLAWKYESFKENLKSYKYKNDVVMTGYLEQKELVKIIGSAYGLVYPSLFSGFGLPVLEAIQCDVPVITSADSAMQEITKDAALYVDPNNTADIADKMMLLYKDEKLRKEMIKKGKKEAIKYNWDRTAELFWQTICKTADKGLK